MLRYAAASRMLSNGETIGWRVMVVTASIFRIDVGAHLEVPISTRHKKAGARARKWHEIRDYDLRRWSARNAAAKRSISSSSWRTAR